MDDEKIKAQIGSNIATCRKSAGLTQAGLAEKLNYSDKAVSKWERGESVPDVLTLMQLSTLFGVSLDRLVRDPSLSDPQLPVRGYPAGTASTGRPSKSFSGTHKYWQGSPRR